MISREVIKCFLIDDDPEEYEIFLYAVQQLSFAVECQYFKTPQLAIQAVQSAQESCPAHIFLDVNMPAMTVSEQIGRLQSEFPYPKTRIALYSSAFPIDSLRKLAGAENIAYCYKKPTVGALRKMLEEYFGQLNNSHAQP